MPPSERKSYYGRRFGPYLRSAAQIAAGIATGYAATKAVKAIRGQGRRPGGRLVLRSGTGMGVRTKKRFRGYGSNITTSQHDVRQSRPKQRGLSRRQRVFQKKVRKAITGNAPLNVLNESIVAPLIFATGATVSSALQYPGGSNASSTAIDLRLMANVNASWAGFLSDLRSTVIGRDRAATLVDAFPVGGKSIDQCLIQQTINTTWKNTSEVGFVLDIYECVAKQDMSPNSDYRTAGEAWNFALGNMNTMIDNVVPIVGGASIRSGNTPYNCRGFSDYWKIYKYTRFNMASGEKVTYSYSTKYRNINFDKWDQKECKKGFTKDIIFVFAPTFSSDLPAEEEYARMEWNRITSVRYPGLPAGNQVSYSASKNV